MKANLMKTFSCQNFKSKFGNPVVALNSATVVLLEDCWYVEVTVDNVFLRCNFFSSNVCTNRDLSKTDNYLPIKVSL